MDFSPLWISGVLWISFVGYWSAAAGNAAPALSSESRSSRRLHQVLLWGAVFVAFIVRFPPLNRRWLPAAALVVSFGIALQVGSLVLACWARQHLGRNWSGAVTIKAGHQLVCTGPYAVIRHPIYTGILGMFLGTSIVSGEWHGLLALALVGLAYGRKIRLEENGLREAFGSDYEAYQAASWSLFPGVF